MGKPPSSSQSKKTLQPSISKFFVKKTVDCDTQPTSSPNQPLLSTASNLSEEEHGIDSYFTQKILTKRPLIREERIAGEPDSDEVARAAKRAKNNEQGLQGDPSSSHKSDVCIDGTTPRPVFHPQTKKYLLSSHTQSTPGETVSNAENHTEEQEQKKKLHNEWMKKMTHIKPAFVFENEENSRTTIDGESEEYDEDEIKLVKKKTSCKAGNLTPLEMQFLEIKRKHLDAILITEVGYKFKFFGEDARIAAKELSIVCIPGKFRYDEHPSEAHLSRFASASIPVHRLPVHAKRLVQAGYKIGIVRQVETAALKKAGDNRNTPFIRKLTNIYTKGTYIDDAEEISCPINTSDYGNSTTGYLLCLTQSKLRELDKEEKVKVGVLAVQPSTGDIIHDTFEDGFLHGETQTRLMHLNPCEILIVGELAQVTEKLVQHLSTNSTNIFGDGIRVERIGKEKNLAATAHSLVSQFYATKLKNEKNSDKNREQDLLEKVLKLSDEVTICLSAMITYLSEFGLEHLFNLTQYFEPFSTHSHMLLSANTLTSLEIFKNQTECTAKGSLFWCLDKTQTRFGQRLLRKWIGRPLLDKLQIEDRVDAIGELKDNYQSPDVQKIQSLLRSIKSDLERSLIRIYYGKCNRPELLSFLETLKRMSNEFSEIKNSSDTGFKSTLLRDTILSLPLINSTINEFLIKISVEPARQDDKYAFFHPDYEDELITDYKMGIAVVEQELDTYCSRASLALKKSKPLSYTTNAGIEYLFEVQNSDLKHVPASWIKVSGNKKISRFHMPEVICMLRERDQHKESLTSACDAAFSEFLSQISQHYTSLRDVINALATLDCLHSLCLVALQPGYNKPEISSSTSINIIHGRHPMVEQLLQSAYIANNTYLSTTPGKTRALCITGPNMGGKSSYVRHVALLVLMAQIGSYLPCESANIGLFDGIYTRMGAYDSLFTRQSTFQIELSETATILQSATTRSLVILDELGRGTSTHDGVAIAGSTLEWLVREKNCICLFITHYQSLATVAKRFESDSALKNMHMKFESNNTANLNKKLNLDAHNSEGDEVTFLYEIGDGIAHRSYGLNVARLANIPKAVLETAAKKSREMEIDVKQKKIHYLLNVMNNLLQNKTGTDLKQLIIGIEEL